MALNAAEPAGYYKACDGKTSQALLSQLLAIVGPHTNIGYDGLWDLYKTSDVDESGKIWDIYSTKRWSTGEKCGSYSAVGSCYNREHSLPKSWFNEASPMKSDGFHIYPTDGKVNGQRSNYPYGECASGTTLSAPSGIKALGRLGTSTFPGYSGIVFEPDDEYKGDLARTYFYMAAAYNDKISGWNSDMLASNSYPVFNQWAIDLLLKWHRQDPVSQKEINRNEAIYASQHNRNPFIDRPDLAEYIWGNKTGEKWYSTGSPEPTLILPTENSTIDFGITATDYTISRSVTLRGENLSGTMTVAIDNPAFTASAQSVATSQFNGKNSSLSISFRSSQAGTATATLTLKTASITRQVALTAKCVGGIPALEATDVTAESFTARWLDLGDEDYYTLDVTTGGKSIDGYPRKVYAALEEYDVEDLAPETLYTYTLSNSTLSSEAVNVTTGRLLPSIQVLAGDEALSLTAVPGNPSDAVELWLDIENIDETITAAVEAPFELSADHSVWSHTISFSPEQDRVYLRVNSATAGEFESAITFTAGNYLDDNTEVTAKVADNSHPWFIETFETITKDITYSTTSVTGSACTWNVTDYGFFRADKPASGNMCARLGKTSSSTLATAAAKQGGIGTVEFDACRWSSSDGNVTLAIEYSPDGTDWIPAGEAILDSDAYKHFTVTVNVPGNNFLRLRQTAGARGNIDDISVSDYQAGVNGIEYADGWDAFASQGTLIVDNRAETPRRFIVYNLEGIVLANREIPHGTYNFNLSAGLYIVASDALARRVVVK